VTRSGRASMSFGFTPSPSS